MKEKPHNILHIASHGFFCSTAEDSFIMTYDKILDLNQLESLLSADYFKRFPIDLLTLSACQTAKGDDRSPLGISGVAVKTKVHSALGSLWSVSDETTAELMASFYSSLNKPNQTKAKALQEAMLGLLKQKNFTRGYEKEIVLLVIGSLADPCCGRCFDIVPKQKATENIQFLQLSDRGKVLIGASEDKVHNPLCFSFDYLQLVTDDFWLSFPTPWFHDIYVDASIAHTLKEERKYRKGASETLEKKIPAVLYFLRVLKAAMNWECTMRPALKEHPSSALIPDFSVIEENILTSCERILTYIDNGSVVMQDAKSLRKTLNNDLSFDEHFVNYGLSGLLISTDM